MAATKTIYKQLNVLFFIMDAYKIIQEVQKRYDDSSLRIVIKDKNNQEVLMNRFEKEHSQLIAEWAVKLFGEENDVVKVAAAAHDWDRTFPERRVPYESSPEKYLEYKINHSLNTAVIFNENFGDVIENSQMRDICYLIRRHEIGGRKDADGNLLYMPDSSNSFNLDEAAEKIQMADSISGFIAFLDKGPLIESRGEKYGRKKMSFYYERASK